MKLFNTNSTKTPNVVKLASLGMTLTILAAVILVTDPVTKIVESQLALKTGSLLYNLWLKPPLGVYITVYMFNVTNYEAYTRGYDKKLKVTEVGPYVYQEILENHNITFNDNNTVTYTPRRVVKFIREKSVGDPKVDKIIAPNIPYMGVTSAASSYSTFAALAISALTRKLNSKPMLEMTVHEYLWGYEDNLVHLASKIIPSVINFQRFGLMERMFDEGDNVVTMQLPRKKTSGEDEVKTARDFSIDTWNGGQSIKYWTQSNQNVTNCNGIRGTYDGTLFPRNITKGETFRIYRKAFCRTLPIVYSHPGKIDGIEAYHFKLHEKAFDSDINDPDSGCFCLNKKCLKRGLGNITPCYYNIPMAISFPHFFNADPSLLDNIEGLNPDEAKHGSEIVIQPQLGIPMRVHSRFQINLLIDEVKYNREMTRFRNTVLPVFWLEIVFRPMLIQRFLNKWMTEYWCYHFEVGKALFASTWTTVFGALPMLVRLYFSTWGVEELTPGIKMLLKLLFKICPYVQCGLIIALIVAGLSLVGMALLSCFWLPTSVSSSSSSSPTGAVAATFVSLQKKRQTQKCTTLLMESASFTSRKKLNKKNVCIIPLLPTTQAVGIKTTKMRMLLPPPPTVTPLQPLPPQVAQQKNMHQNIQNYTKKDNLLLLPFLQNDYMT